MPKEVTHLSHPNGRTYCGKSRQQYVLRGVAYWRTRVLPIIGPNELIDSATCKACQRVDDAAQVREHLKDCQRASIDPDTLEPLPKAKS